jgi:hypothetical protein
MPTQNLPEAPSKTESNGTGRRPDGKFTAGNRIAVGNPHARKVAALKSALLEAITPEKMRELAHALHQQAIRGDIAAAQLLLRYTVGKPAEAVSPDRLALDEIKLLREYPDVAEVVRVLVACRVSPELAAGVAALKTVDEPLTLGAKLDLAGKGPLLPDHLAQALVRAGRGDGHSLDKPDKEEA